MDCESKYILDMTCGGRSIWFNKQHPNAIYFDQRDIEYEQTFGKSQPATRHIRVHPDVMGDFTNLPFDNGSFNLVVFDPPHIISESGDNRWYTHAYGHYKNESEALKSVATGMHEAFRVLKIGGGGNFEMGRSFYSYT